MKKAVLPLSHSPLFQKNFYTKKIDQPNERKFDTPNGIKAVLKTYSFGESFCPAFFKKLESFLPRLFFKKAGKAGGEERS